MRVVVRIKNHEDTIMQTALIIGKAHATVKHPGLEGWTMLVAQPLTLAGQPDAEPQLTLDRLGCRVGDRVMITTDGSLVHELSGRNDVPARYITLGIEDQKKEKN